MDPDKETVVFVEFDSEGYPYSVMTAEQNTWGVGYNDYDFAWSKRWGLLYHLSGFGGKPSAYLGQTITVNPDNSHTPVEVVYWAAPLVEVKECQLCRRLETLPEEWTAEKLFGSLNTINAEDGILWCSRCEDHLPDYVPDYCEHIWQCWICDTVNTPDEHCGHPRGAEEEEG